MWALTPTIALYRKSFEYILIVKPLFLSRGARGGVDATNRQFAGSIPDDVIGNFQWHNPSGRAMALGSTQPLTEMSTRCISWG
jgi:hypothetical protein